MSEKKNNTVLDPDMLAEALKPFGKNVLLTYGGGSIKKIGLYDKVLLVTAPYGVRVQRNPKASERDALQTFDPARADWILKNEGTKEELNIKIRQLICKLI